MTQDLDTIWNTITTMLKNSPEGFAEEWSIHGYENFGEECRLSESESIKTVHEMALCVSVAVPGSDRRY